MTKISQCPHIYKILFPLGAFIPIGVGTYVAIIDQSLVFMIPILFVSGILIYLYKKNIWPLEDEVYDAGEYLLLRKGNRECRIEICDISKIEHKNFNAPELVIIHLKTTEDRFYFSPPFRIISFRKSSIISELISKINRQRGTEE